MTRLCPHCGKSIGNMERLSVSIPAGLATYVRRRAQTEGRTVSAVVAEALREHRDAVRRLESVS